MSDSRTRARQLQSLRTAHRNVREQLARINVGLGPVNSIEADAEDQPEGVVRVYDDHADALCHVVALARELATVDVGDWEAAWGAITACSLRE